MSIFEETFHVLKRLPEEDFETYRERRKERKRFMKMYTQYGRDKYIQFVEFMKKMGEQENNTHDEE